MTTPTPDPIPELPRDPEIVTRPLVIPSPFRWVEAREAAAYARGVEEAAAEVARLTAENEQLRADLEEAERAIATLGAGRDVYRARVQAVRDLCERTITLSVPVRDLRAAIGDGDDRG